MRFALRQPAQCAVRGCRNDASRGGICVGHADAVIATKRAGRLERELASAKRQSDRPAPATAKPFAPLPGRECTYVDQATGTPCALGRLLDSATGEPMPGGDRCGLHA